MNESDQIARARQGSETAWAALVQLHQAPVFHLAYLILGNEHDAEDVAQDAFIRAFHALDRFDETRPLRPWLLKIARNLAYNRRRSLRRYWNGMNRLWNKQPQTAPDPHEQTQQQAQADQLWQAVRRLKQQDQDVIYLRYFLELPTAETADTLGLAEGTVKSRLARALDRLKQVVEAEYPALWEEYSP